MHSDVRESFARNGYIFPVQFLSDEEKQYYAERYREYSRIYGTKGTQLRWVR